MLIADVAAATTAFDRFTFDHAKAPKMNQMACPLGSVHPVFIIKNGQLVDRAGRWASLKDVADEMARHSMAGCRLAILPAGSRFESAPKSGRSSSAL